MQRINLLLGRFGSELEALLALRAADSLAEFWRLARGELRAALPIHGAWLRLPGEGVAALAQFRAETACRSEAEFREFVDRHPAASALAARPGTRLLRLSDLHPTPRLRALGFYRKFMAPQGDRFAATLGFWRGPKCEGLIGVERRQAEGDFTRAEMRVLEELQRQLEPPLLRLLKLARERRERQAIGTVFEQLPVAAVVLNWDLAVVHCTLAARKMSAIWRHGRDRARLRKLAREFTLPRQIADLCQQIKAAGGGDLRSVARAAPRIVAPGAGAPACDIRASVRVLEDRDGVLDGALFLIVIEDSREPRAGGAAAGEETSGRMAHLSPREQEVARLVCKGHRDREVATQLGKSVLTVKKQMRSIFQKLDVQSRAKLMVLLQAHGDRS